MKHKVLDLFSGIGGFSLGLERTGGFETVAFCEIDPFCQKVLEKNFPDGVDEIRYPWHSGKLSIPQPRINASHYYLSPIFNGNLPIQDNIKHCIQLCLDNPQWKISTQMHKIWNVL